MIRLRPARAADFGFIRQLAQDPANAPFISDEDENQLARYQADPTSALLIAETKGDGPAPPIGYALFCELGEPSGRVELRRLALAQTGGGRGRDFVNALIDWAFTQHPTQRLWLDASGENPRAMALYEKLGFQREGILRQHWYRPCLGRVVDMHLFGLLRAEWQALRQTGDQPGR